MTAKNKKGPIKIPYLTTYIYNKISCITFVVGKHLMSFCI